MTEIDNHVEAAGRLVLSAERPTGRVFPRQKSGISHGDLREIQIRALLRGRLGQNRGVQVAVTPKDSRGED